MPPTLAIAPKQPTRTGWALLLTSVAFFMVTLDSLVGCLGAMARVGDIDCLVC